jgi:adenosylmethionine-8-amino-7-oxononanoate aminotransferase
VPPIGYLDRLRSICDRNGILLEFDEVICGFCQTGKAFGSNRFGVTRHRVLSRIHVFRRSIGDVSGPDLLIKWTGDTGIVAPTFIVERAHIDEIVDTLRRALATG